MHKPLRRVIKTIMALFTASLLIGSCGVEDDKANSDTEQEYKMGADMTEEEKAFIKNISFDKNNVDSLDEWQTQMLDEYRCGVEYLSIKYPSSQIFVVNCETHTDIRKFDRFLVMEKDDNDNSYEMRIWRLDDDLKKYEIKDDFYRRIIKEEAGERICDILNNINIPCYDTHASFTGCLGEDYGENIDVDEALKGIEGVDNSFLLYINDSKLDHGSYEYVTQEIRECMINNEVRGEFVVIITASNEASDDSLYRNSFYID